jgi:H+/gluconate symporter-like permease
MIVLILASIGLAFLLKLMSVNIFGRAIRMKEVILAGSIIVLVPNSGFLWLALELFNSDIGNEFRESMRPATWVCLIATVVSIHAIVTYFGQDIEDGKL